MKNLFPMFIKQYLRIIKEDIKKYNLGGPDFLSPEFSGLPSPAPFDNHIFKGGRAV